MLQTLRGWEPDDSWHDTATATLTDWKSWNKLAPLLVETAMAHRKVDSKQHTSVEKEENRTEPRAVRIELALSRNLEKEKSIETREASWKSIAKDENAKTKSRICSHKILPRPLLNPRRPGGADPIRETTLGGAVEKHESGLCWWNVDLTKETGKRLEKSEERERVTGSDHSTSFESIASIMFGEAGKVAVVDVLGYEVPGRLAVFIHGDGSESGGCNVLDQVQAYRWTVCDAKSLGLRLAQVAPSTEIRECAGCVCAEDACRCCLVFCC